MGYTMGDGRNITGLKRIKKPPGPALKKRNEKHQMAAETLGRGVSAKLLDLLLRCPG